MVTVWISHMFTRMFSMRDVRVAGERLELKNKMIMRASGC